jgi:hypothetical protein
MMKLIGPLCAAAIVSAGLLSVPAEARDRNERRCGHAVELNTRFGADVGAIVGTAMPRNDCGDSFHYGRAHYDAMRHGRPYSWHNPNTGHDGSFRIKRTYRVNGYWERGLWHSSTGTYRESRRAGYRQTMCREYTATSNRPRHFFETRVACLDGVGIWRVVS